jgi:hypothetical protein
MRAHLLAGSVCLAAILGCGLESLFSNVGGAPNDRPASIIRGRTSWAGARESHLTVIDGNGDEIQAFERKVEGGRYEIRLPSARYSMIQVQARAGNLLLRAIVPSIGEETAIDGVDLDARSVTETLVVEARLGADGKRFPQLTPSAYVGDGIQTGTRTLIRQDLDLTTPTRDLLLMIERLLAFADPASGQPDPDFFTVPVLDGTFQVTESPVSSAILGRLEIDYDGDGARDTTTAALDAKLAQVAQLPGYDPAGCPDPDRIRLVLSVDFNEGAKNGNCGNIDRFKWAKDKPGKQMFFVGWLYTDVRGPEPSPIKDPAVNNLLGAGVPNQIPMYDDATNGDEVSGDNVWTVTFDVPRRDPANPGDPSRIVRVGYKYTWGTRGAPWTGSEEWPGNSRILEVVDVNGDDFVHRRDVFGDEATNKNFTNLNLNGTGSIGWTTVLLGAAAGCVDLLGNPIPEAREQPSTPGSACTCTSWVTPQSIGPLRVACGP